jgi:hypothetical protein
MKGGASLSRMTGSRNIGLNKANVNVLYTNINPSEKVESYGSSPTFYAKPTSGEISIIPSVLKKATATRSHSPKPQTPKQEQFIGGKRRRTRSARRKTRKTLRHSHRRK